MVDLLEFLRTNEEAFRSRARLASLYSDFRYQQHINPDGYHANASAWIRGLKAAANAGVVPAPTGSQHDRFVLQTGEELLRSLHTQEYGRPLALGSVIDEAVRKRELVPLQQFLDTQQSIYAKTWLPTPWQVMSWGLRQLGIIGKEVSDDKLVAGNFVIMANVEAAAKATMDYIAKTATSKASRVFSKDLFAATISSQLGAERLSQKDLSVLLIHLARDQQAIAYDAPSGTIKFRGTSDTTAAVVEQEDVTIASLRSLIASLESQIPDLANRVTDFDSRAREAVTAKQLTAAKSAVRQKKLAESKLQQRTATLTQLEEVYAKIEQAADQVEVVRIMQASSQALRSLNQKTGGIEKVQDVMEELKEEMMNADEIQTAINDVSTGSIDEAEVDDELEALEQMEREKAEEAERSKREKKEAEEAERTKVRLAELEEPKEELAPHQSQESETEVKQEAPLQEPQPENM